MQPERERALSLSLSLYLTKRLRAKKIDDAEQEEQKARDWNGARAGASSFLEPEPIFDEEVEREKIAKLESEFLQKFINRLQDQIDEDIEREEAEKERERLARKKEEWNAAFGYFEDDKSQDKNPQRGSAKGWRQQCAEELKLQFDAYEESGKRLSKVFQRDLWNLFGFSLIEYTELFEDGGYSEAHDDEELEPVKQITTVLASDDEEEEEPAPTEDGELEEEKQLLPDDEEELLSDEEQDLASGEPETPVSKETEEGHESKGHGGLRLTQQTLEGDELVGISKIEVEIDMSSLFDEFGEWFKS